MTARRKQSPLIWIIEAFSVVTAGAFVTSGLFNGLVFFTKWQLNYFSIASPSDIVISGFFIGIILAIPAFVLTIPILFRPNIGPRDATFFHSYMKWVISEKSKFRRGESTFKRMIAVEAVTWSPIVIVVMIFAFGVFSLFHSFRDSDFDYSSNLKLAPSAQVDQDCGGAPVLWMGSSAAILGCKRGVRVYHKLDGIVTEPLSVKRDPKEYLPPVQAPAPKAAVSAPPCRDGKPDCDPWERAWKMGETPTKGSVVARDGAITLPSNP